MVLDIVLVVLGFCFLLGGLAGCILPAIPGPPLCYIALLLLEATPYADFSTRFLVITAVITVFVTILDYFIPIWSTRKWGGSKSGAIGAGIGLVIGLFFSPWGIILGPFLGAVAGELISGRDTDQALKSGLGSFVGFLLGTGLKLALCFVFAFYFVKELIV